MVPRFVPGTPTWGAEDSAALRAFLLTASGQKTLLNLNYLRPMVTTFNREVRSVQSDIRAGYEEAIASLMALADPQGITAEDVAAHQQSVTQTINTPAPGQ